MDLVSDLNCLFKTKQFFSYTYLYVHIFFVFIVFNDEELNILLDRSDMVNSVPNSNVIQSAEHFKVMNTS